MSEYRKAKRQIDVSPGESVKIIRELQEYSQNDLSRISGIPQSGNNIRFCGKFFILGSHPNLSLRIDSLHIIQSVT